MPGLVLEDHVKCNGTRGCLLGRGLPSQVECLGDREGKQLYLSLQLLTFGVLNQASIADSENKFKKKSKPP